MSKLLLILFFSAVLLRAAENTENKSDSLKVRDEKGKIHAEYGSRGWQFSTGDGNFVLQIQTRFQFRYSQPYDTDPVTFDDFKTGSFNSLRVNRARLKVGGNAYKPWLKFYWEYDFPSSRLLDAIVMIVKLPYFNVKAGQWKVRYSRERIISSGKQQMADRSLINRAFTLDRQQGISFYGNLDGGGAANFSYWASILSGTGRGEKSNDDDALMFMFRGQWNFLGSVLKFSGSDTKVHKKAAGSIALAGVTNQSAYTRFSTAGGGQLPGFEEGVGGQYRINQLMLETAYQFSGFAWQQELHWKQIKDYKNKETTEMCGNYFQLGYFLHRRIAAFPKQLEIAFRHTFYIPDLDIENNRQQEFSLAANWFFYDHANKLTGEITYFKFQDETLKMCDTYRFRLQWDISF